MGPLLRVKNWRLLKCQQKRFGEKDICQQINCRVAGPWNFLPAAQPAAQVGKGQTGVLSLTGDDACRTGEAGCWNYLTVFNTSVTANGAVLIALRKAFDKADTWGWSRSWHCWSALQLSFCFVPYSKAGPASST